MRPDKVDATLGKRREKDARIVAAAKTYSAEVTRQSRETLDTTKQVWSEIPALESKRVVSETSDSYDRTRQEDYKVYRPHYEHLPAYQETAANQLRWQSTYSGQHEFSCVPQYEAMKDQSIFEQGGSKPSGIYHEYSVLRSHNIQPQNFLSITESEHEVKNFPLFNTSQLKTLTPRFNETPFVRNQTSVIKRNVMNNRHDLRKENLTHTPIDNETQSHVLAQHEKTTIVMMGHEDT